MVRIAYVFKDVQREHISLLTENKVNKKRINQCMSVLKIKYNVQNCLITDRNIMFKIALSLYK